MTTPDDLRRSLERLPGLRKEKREGRLTRQAEARRMYSNEAGEAVFRRSFVTYIDEPGTRAAAPNLNETQLRKNIADSDRLRDMLSDVDSPFEDDSRVLTFSDNIVVGTPTQPSSAYGDEGQFFQIASIALYILNQAVLGRFYRGGFTVGALYIDDSYVAGPALVEAVDLEEKVAVNPRVLLSGASVDLALDHLRDHSGGDPFGEPYNWYLLQDSDDELFVNYLGAAGEDEQYVEGALERALLRHRDAVLTRAAGAGSDPRVQAKYDWLVGYHNWVATNLFDVPNAVIENAERLPEIRRLVDRPPPA